MTTAPSYGSGKNLMSRIKRSTITLVVMGTQLPRRARVDFVYGENRPLSFLSIVGGLSYNAIVHPFSDLPLTGTDHRYLYTFSDVVTIGRVPGWA